MKMKKEKKTAMIQYCVWQSEVEKSTVVSKTSRAIWSAYWNRQGSICRGLGVNPSPLWCLSTPKFSLTPIKIVKIVKTTLLTPSVVPQIEYCKPVFIYCWSTEFECIRILGAFGEETIGLVPVSA